MNVALDLARRGVGRVSPNPMVGAVLVKNRKVVGRGWHRRFGGPHAEVEALRRAGPHARGATLYVTLEPCSHYGKTPPCVDVILAAGVRRVVSAMTDPNPSVKGGGSRILARKGVEVATGLLEGEAESLNRAFVTWARTGRPLVTLKLATSLDGGVATRAGDSKWITGLAARKHAHRLRAEHDAVVVGGATILADDPSLTVRYTRGKNPSRIVIDTRLVSSPKARWCAGDGARRVIVCGGGAPERKRRAFEKAGVEVWTLPTGSSRGIPLGRFLKKAGASGFLSLLVEGGGGLAGAFLSSGLVDRVRIFMAPVLLGGKARTWTQGIDADRLALAPRLKSVRLKRFGSDWLVEGEV